MKLKIFATVVLLSLIVSFYAFGNNVSERIERNEPQRLKDKLKADLTGLNVTSDSDYKSHPDIFNEAAKLVDFQSFEDWQKSDKTKISALRMQAALQNVIDRRDIEICDSGSSYFYKAMKSQNFDEANFRAVYGLQNNFLFSVWKVYAAMMQKL